MDFILNGQGSGNVASVLLANDMDHNALRPFIGDDGRTVYVNRVMRNSEGHPIFENGAPKMQAIVTNTPGTLRYQDWLTIDEAIIKVAQPQLKLWGDLVSRGLTYTIGGGMGKTVLMSENQSDINPATISMDGLRQGDNDRPIFDYVNLPLPIIHKDFSFSARQIAVSRQGGSPLDTTTAELAGRKVVEAVEKLTSGTYGTYFFGGGYIYGYTNFPSRMTKVLTDPSSPGWTPSLFVDEVLAMKAQAVAKNHRGPFMVYVSQGWDKYLDADYSQAKGDKTLRERVAAIKGIAGVETADYLDDMAVLLVEMNREVVRAVQAMPLTTVQWEVKGGLEVHYKVMCIMVPQLRVDQIGQTGLVHGEVP